MYLSNPHDSSIKAQQAIKKIQEAYTTLSQIPHTETLDGDPLSELLYTLETAKQRGQDYLVSLERKRRGTSSS